MTKKKQADWETKFDIDFNRKTTLAEVNSELYDVEWLKKEAIKKFVKQQLK